MRYDTYCTVKNKNTGAGKPKKLRGAGTFRFYRIQKLDKIHLKCYNVFKRVVSAE